ncbi:MAG: phage tail tape measure protein [Rhodobacteraceae bacterium]|nr:phage tail tape measure protein [Paracoccaceae bacterium]
MAELLSDLEQLDSQIDALEGSIASTSVMTASFQAELRGMQTSISLAEREARGFSRALSRGLRAAFGDVIFEGAKLSDVLKNVAQSMIQSTFNQAVSPVTDALAGVVGGIFGGLFPRVQGSAVPGAQVSAYANGGGGVPSTGFGPLAGNAGSGARAAAGGNITVNMNVKTPDAESFRKSQTQIAAGLSRAIQRGNRNQ